MEIDAIVSAASNMEDDFSDYFSFVPDPKKFESAFISGMNKLRKHNQAREMTKQEEQAHGSLNDN